MTEIDNVCELIREVGVPRLGGWEGCCCCDFSVRSVHVDISCGKGSRGQAVWIWSHHMDYDDKETLRPVMEEVIRQLKELSGRGGDFAQHFYEWKMER